MVLVRVLSVSGLGVWGAEVLAALGLVCRIQQFGSMWGGVGLCGI